MNFSISFSNTSYTAIAIGWETADDPQYNYDINILNDHIYTTSCLFRTNYETSPTAMCVAIGW